MILGAPASPIFSVVDIIIDIFIYIYRCGWTWMQVYIQCTMIEPNI